MRAGTRIRLATAVAGVTLLGSVTGCSVQSAASGAGAGPAKAATVTTTATPTPTVPLATATVTTAHGLKAALPSDPITVTVTGGALSAVSVKDAAGKAVEGTLTGATWKPTRNLLPDAAYTVTATATNEAGIATPTTVPLRTLKPETIAKYDLLYTDMTVGVGMPATIQFASAVTSKAQRAAIEKAATVTTVPAQRGSWGWLDNRQLMWRPEGYWKPGTKVTINAKLAGLQTGPSKWVGRDATGSFTVGDTHVSYVDIAKHTMTVTSNGKAVRTMPVTTGKAGFITRSGVKVIISKAPHMVMDSTTIDIPAGSPDSYNLDVKYPMRLTWTGEFIHAAPWSVGQQGRANVSHGCTGMSVANTQWLYGFSRPGDLVIYSGSKRPLLPTDGIGVWTYSWGNWQQQSALV